MEGKLEQREISFDPIPHKYHDQYGNEYISATTILGRYKKPFDKAYWSMYKALKANGYRPRPSNVAGRTMEVKGKVYHVSELYETPMQLKTTPQDLLDEWETLTKLACDVGNIKHDSLETAINISKNDVQGRTNDNILPFHFTETITEQDLANRGVMKKHPKIYSWLCKYLAQGWVLYAEKRIYSSQHLIAGMIDVLAMKGKQFAILDWKTNKAPIRYEAGYFKKDAFGKITTNWYSTDARMLPPLNHLPESKGYTYALQLSLYAHLMELWGYKFAGIQLCHIQGIPGILTIDRFKDFDENTSVHNMPYLKNEIESIFDERLKELKNE